MPLPSRMDWYWILRSRGFRLFIIFAAFVIFLTIVISVLVGRIDNSTPLEHAAKLLTEIVLFDGHNDFFSNVRHYALNNLSSFNFSQNWSEIHPWAFNNFSRTDLFRLKVGEVKAQFWVARAECDSQFKDAVETTLEQIDVIKRLIAVYSSDMALATSHDEILESVKVNKIASLITVCCGHSIQWSFAILRLYYELGVRALTLVPATCPIPWGDPARVDSPNASTRLRPFSNGLSKFGKEVIWEMNRIGMIIDISESSSATMTQALLQSKAPVIFSHSAARSLCYNEQNIPDDVLRLVRERDAIVMVTFYPNFLKCDGVNVTISDVIEHLEHFRKLTTIDNIGIGSDFDSVGVVTEGLEDVSKFPNLFAALIETGRWTDDDLTKLAGGNILRIMKAVEDIRDSMQNDSPSQSWIKMAEVKKVGYDGTCVASPVIENPPPVPFDFGKIVIPKGI